MTVPLDGPRARMTGMGKKSNGKEEDGRGSVVWTLS
jgi:hypothetical protein